MKKYLDFEMYEQKLLDNLQKNNISNFKLLKVYSNKLLSDLNHSVGEISEKNFWDVFPYILGIDSRLNLLLIYLENNLNLSETQIIQLIEKDFKHFNKENCGLNFQQKTPPSLIFHVK